MATAQNFKIKAHLMTAKEMDRALTRIAHEIVERNAGVDNLYLVGIQRRGVTLARRLADKLEAIEGERPALGILDITFYRDDLSLLSANPVGNETFISEPIQDRTIILGRPAAIQLAVLIDRGHRQLPLRPDYVGKNVPTSKNELALVRVDEFDGSEEVLLGELLEDKDEKEE